MGAGTIGGGGIGMLLLVLAVSCLTGTNPLALLQMAEQVAPQQTQSVPTGAPTNDPAAEFVAVVLADTEETWTPRLLGRRAVEYQRAGAGAVRGRGAVGVRLAPRRRADRSIARPIRRSISICRSSASSISDSARPATSRRPTSSRTKSGITCRHCSASIGRCRKRSRAAAAPAPTRCRCGSSCRPTALPASWGHHANKKQLLDPGDVDEGLSAAAAIGDDRLTGGRVSPESFTHGTSEQRARWLRQGLSDAATSTAAIRSERRRFRGLRA